MHPWRFLLQRRFFPLFCTQFLGAFNDNFLKNALVILITYQTLSVFKMPAAQIVVLAGGVFILPFFLFSALAGQLADKYDKAVIIRWIKLAEIAIMIVAALGFYFMWMEELLFCLFLMGLHSTFFGPVKYSILPQLLNESEMVLGNAWVEAGTFLAILLGTIMGGVLVVAENGPTWVGFGMIFIAVLGYGASRFIAPIRPTQPDLRIDWHWLRPTRAMFRFARQSPRISCSVVGISWFWFLGAALLSLFPSLSKDVLFVGEGAVTLFLALFSVGIGVGSLLCAKWSGAKLRLSLVPWSWMGMAICTGLLAAICEWTPHVPSGARIATADWLVTTQGVMMMANLLILSLCGGFYAVPLYTMMQESAPVTERSRVVAANNVLNSLYMVGASLLLLGLLALGLSVPMVFLVLSAVAFTVGIGLIRKLPHD